jgi:hypothetical protein
VTYSNQLLDHLRHAHQSCRDWYADYVDEDDLHQEMAIYVAENRDQLQKWIDTNEEHRVKLALKSVARIYGTREKARALGFEYEDVAWYSPEGLVSLIPLALDSRWDGLTGEPEETGMPGAGSPANEGGTLLAMVLDVRRVIESGTWLVSDFDLESEQGVANLEWLADRLGGQYPAAPGYRREGRKSMDNNEAQHLTKEQG